MILLSQVQTGNTSENLLNKIREIVYLLYQAKQISKSIKQFTQISKDECNISAFRKQ